jgi:hypothetical protein
VELLLNVYLVVLDVQAVLVLIQINARAVGVRAMKKSMENVNASHISSK